MPYLPYHCSKCGQRCSRYHNVKKLTCPWPGCDGQLVPGNPPKTHVEQMERWITSHSDDDEHPIFPLADWMLDAADGTTRKSYYDWLRQQAAGVDEEPEEWPKNLDLSLDKELDGYEEDANK